MLKLWKHPKMKDVALEIISCEDRGDGSSLVHLCWWNIGPHEPQYMNIHETKLINNNWLKELTLYRRTAP